MSNLSSFADLVRRGKGLPSITEEVIHKSVMSEAVSLLSVKEKKEVPLVNIDQLNKDVQFLKNRSIPQVTAGSGEVRILRMDDIDISNISDGRMVVWSDTAKKFKFVDVPIASNIGRPTTVISSDYTVVVGDHYIGVNSVTPITITLPNTFTSGTEFIIKDESGNSSLIPITISGNIDNDPNGVILQSNNSSITVIYRNGWRII